MERGLEQLFVDQKVAMESKGTRTFVDLQFYYLHSLLSPTHVQFLKANHRMTTTVQRRIYGHATDVEIRPLNEEKAVQAAVDLLGEIFVFSVPFLSIFNSLYLTSYLFSVTV
ncbi:uncharacterized protein LOC111381489 isoform X1 [Olea europaea var. sylvestris]|uniref:uncharacterized protein LOC111381489 isoform X1 n=1 Tax=Olea europaea var. sylvestris TaxID=158386 RepID=UPI000C1D3229|nr:uncharacterized protein LOC111381489 isoform X1 [Olea europaea var. sylvestris]